MEHSTGEYFINYTYYNMDILPKRKSSSDIEKQNISRLSDGYIQCNADEHCFDHHDLSISNRTLVDELDSDFYLFYTHSPYGNGVFFLCCFYRLCGQYEAGVGAESREYTWDYVHTAGSYKSVQ